MPVITTVLAAGLLSARPTASASNAGFYFVATDVNGGTLFQSTGSAWVQIAAAVTQTAAGVGAVANAGGAPSLQVGPDASKPTAGTAGRLYVATDTTIIYEDSGSAWVEVATAAPTWGMVVGKPSTFTPSVHESTHLSGGTDAISGLSQSQIAVDTTEAATNDALSGSLLANLDRLRYQLAQLGTGAWNTLRAMVQLSPGSQQTGTINVSGEVQGSDFKPGGVTGASAAARYHAATASGHPTTGTWAVGDIVPDQTGTFWFCTVAGTPGTWVQVGGTGGGGGSSTLAGDTDVSIASPVGGQVLGYNGGTSKWQNQNVAGVAATTSTAQLGADVTMTSANTYYDGPTVTVGPGTWLLVAGASIHEGTGAAGQVTGRIWDGTTSFTSQQTAMDAATAALTLECVVTPTVTTTYRLSVAGQSAGYILKAATNTNPVGNNASYLNAIQLSGNPVGQLAPAVRCYNSANISVPSGASTALTFDTNRFDQGTASQQHSTSSNTSRLTCQQAGVYQISAMIRFAGSAAGNERDVNLRLNGATIIAEETQIITPTSPATNVEMIVSTLYQLDVGDYVEVAVYQDTGGALNILTAGNYSPEFGMARIDSGPGAVQPNTKIQLDYAASTDLANGTSISATTWTDVVPNQAFSVDDPNSVIEIQVEGLVLVGNSTGVQNWGARLVIDSAGSAVYKRVGGCRAPGSEWSNVLAGSSTVDVTGLSAGSHTVKLQIYGDAAGTAYCQAGTQANTYDLSIRVLERKQSSSPPSSTPAPAVRCYNNAAISIPDSAWTSLTFNTNRYDQGTSTPQHSTSVNTSRLTCQQSGTYEIITGAQIAGSAGGALRLIRILLNGSTVIGQGGAPVSASGSQTSCSAQWQLQVGDYVEMQIYQNSGGALNVNSDPDESPEFMMARIDSGGQGFVPIPMVKTANYTLTAQDCMVVAGASSLTMTLPAASTRAPGMPIVIKNDNFTSTTIAAAGSDTIDGASSYNLVGVYKSVTLVGDGISVWRVI